MSKLTGVKYFYIMQTIIDFHTHIFPDLLAPRAIAKLIAFSPADRNFTDGTAAGLTQSMKQHGVTQSVTLPIATKKEQVPIIIEQLTRLDRSVFIPFGTIHPDTENIDETVDLLKRNNIRGIKLHPEYQDFYMADQRYFPMYEALSAAGIIIVFHAGKDPGPFTGDHALPLAFKTVRANFPDLKIVAAHMGGWKIWELIPGQLAGENLYFDTSAIYYLLDKNHFMNIARKHGTERLLFGSDSPWFDQGACIAWIDSLPLSDREKEDIFSANASNLLSL